MIRNEKCCLLFLVGRMNRNTCPDLNLWAITIQLLLILVLVNQGIRGGSRVSYFLKNLSEFNSDSEPYI